MARGFMYSLLVTMNINQINIDDQGVEDKIYSFQTNNI